jgi:hypothetical protein
MGCLLLAPQQSRAGGIVKSLVSGWRDILWHLQVPRKFLYCSRSNTGGHII